MPKPELFTDTELVVWAMERAGFELQQPKNRMSPAELMQLLEENAEDNYAGTKLEDSG